MSLSEGNGIHLSCINATRAAAIGPGYASVEAARAAAAAFTARASMGASASLAALRTETVIWVGGSCGIVRRAGRRERSINLAVRVSKSAGCCSRRVHVDGITPTAAAFERKSTRSGLEFGEVEDVGEWLCATVAKIVVELVVRTAEAGANLASRLVCKVSGRTPWFGVIFGNVTDMAFDSDVGTRPHMLSSPNRLNKCCQ